MAPTNLPDPIPRAHHTDYARSKFQVARRQYLDVPSHNGSSDFWTTLERRESRRTFGHLEPASLSTLLWYSGKTWAKTSDRRDPRREHRCLPSAGGLHPIDLVVQANKQCNYEVLLYDSIGHALCELSAKDQHRAKLRAYADKVVDTQDGLVIWLIADFAKVDAYYSNSESLVWRDVGVVLGGICLIGEALQLNCCPLGCCGDEILRRTLDLSDGLHGVGAVVVGQRAELGKSRVASSAAGSDRDSSGAVSN